MLTPLSESLQKLRRAQRTLVRRKRRSRVRVSFQHSTSTRGLKAEPTKTPSSRGKKGKLITVSSSREFNTPTSGPRPTIPHREGSSPQNHSRCPASLPRSRAPQQPIFEKSTRNSSRQLPENRPCFGTLAKSPIRVTPKPGAHRVSLTATPGYIRAGDVGEGRLEPRLIQATQITTHKKSTASPAPAGPRYTVFPKHQSRKGTQVMGKQSTIADVVNSEPGQRSLSQQCRLTSLVPPGRLLASTKTGRPPKQQPQPTVGSKQGVPQVQDSATRDLRSPSQNMAVDKFTRELEEFVEAAGVAGRRVLASASEAEGTHNSVRTVQDFLPYRNQFREAGLAVTSDDQKPPPTERSRLRLQQNRSDEAHLRFDGGRSLDQGSSSTNKPFGSDTVVRVGPSNVAPTGGKLGRFKLSVESAPLPPDRGMMATPKSKTSNTRPSVVFQERKPLPAEPAPPRPTFLSRDRVDRVGDSGRHLHEARTSAVGRPLGGADVTPGSDTSTTAVLYPSTPSSTSQDSSSKFDKCLPKLSSSSTSSQIQQALSFPHKTTWAPPVRQLPVTTEEERVQFPEKQHTPVHKTSIICQEDEIVVAVQNTKNSGTQTTTVVARSSASCKPELPETWKEAIGSPLSFQNALDDVVRKLEDMGEPKSAKAGRPPSGGKREMKPPSPSQRLQRAATMRRQQLAENELNGNGQSGPAGPAIPLRRSGSSKQKSAPLASDPVPAQAHEDGDIKDKDVLAGLKVICSASADQELDSWIHSQTGLRLRRFLSDLKSFEGLAREGIAAVDGERSRRGRAEKRRAWARVERAAKRQSWKK